MKMLYWSDSPLCQTGLGRVSEQLLKIFKGIGFDITVSAINHNFPYYSEKDYPYAIYNGKLFGDDLAVRMTSALLESAKFDVLFIMNDVNVILECLKPILMAKKRNPDMKVIFYPAMDVDYVTEADGVVSEVADYMIWWTDFAYNNVVKEYPKYKDKMSYIPFGFDTDVFYREGNKKTRKYRKEIWGIEDDVYVVGQVNRNQWRKDYFKLIHAFALFNKKHPKSLLYIHAKQNDIGGNLPALIFATATWLKINPREFSQKVMMPNDEEFNTTIGFPIKQLRLIYNSMDLHVSTNQGEGWGLTTAEAMCCETPVIVPDNTSGKMFCGDDRGLLVKCGESLNDWRVNYGNTGGSLLPRPSVDVLDLLDKMEFAYKNKEKLREMTKRGRIYTENNNWKAVENKWIGFLKKII